MSMKVDFTRIVEFQYSMTDDPIGVGLRVPIPITHEEIDLLEEWFALVTKTLRNRVKPDGEGM